MSFNKIFRQQLNHGNHKGEYYQFEKLNINVSNKLFNDKVLWNFKGFLGSFQSFCESLKKFLT